MAAETQVERLWLIEADLRGGTKCNPAERSVSLTMAHPEGGDDLRRIIADHYGIRLDQVQVPVEKHESFVGVCCAGSCETGGYFPEGADDPYTPIDDDGRKLTSGPGGWWCPQCALDLVQCPACNEDEFPGFGCGICDGSAFVTQEMLADCISQEQEVGDV